MRLVYLYNKLYLQKSNVLAYFVALSNKIQRKKIFHRSNVFTKKMSKGKGLEKTKSQITRLRAIRRPNMS